MNTHPGTPITIYEVAELCGKAYSLAFNPVNIQAGFRATGIWQLNQNIFQDHEFLSSAVTDRPDPTQCTVGETTPTQQQPSTSVEDHDYASPVPSTGHSSSVSPEDVSTPLHEHHLELHLTEAIRRVGAEFKQICQKKKS
jgi:hypothetical protein